MVLLLLLMLRLWLLLLLQLIINRHSSSYALLFMIPCDLPATRWNKYDCFYFMYTKLRARERSNIRGMADNRNLCFISGSQLGRFPSWGEILSGDIFDDYSWWCVLWGGSDITGIQWVYPLNTVYDRTTAHNTAFSDSKCQLCHGCELWTLSQKFLLALSAWIDGFWFVLNKCSFEFPRDTRLLASCLEAQKSSQKATNSFDLFLTIGWL